ncbi:ead/Ea22-like family protein [Escherichia coli]|uniref:ead/Ea22-like family protein n=1 Tax=Escherichia coli TaxID=562 RepID=UPI00164F7660|nr:ead/Ea22-like family protein [Escherichia coli]MBC6516646.1 ead/Ea22-like family protein [Escherichia coli]
MKQMSLIEMDGFLKGKCIPSDLKVNETNAEYLVRKFGELESKLETALRECRSAGITIDNLEAKCAALAAENELARKAVHAFCDVVGDNTEVIAEVVGRDGVLVILEAMKATGNMPATDAFLAEVRAQGVEMLAKNHQSIVNALKGDSLFSDGEYRHAAIVSAAVYFAAELRKGGNQ